MNRIDNLVMRRRNLSFAIISLLLFNACNSTKIVPNKKKESKIKMNKVTEINIPFIEAKNYFVKNTVKDEKLTNPKITNQLDFEKYFGMATTMGENGKPTSIDFSKQFVIAVLGKINNKGTNLQVKSLKKIKNTVILTYTKIEGETRTYFSNPFLLIIIDNKFEGKVKLQTN